MLVRSLVSLIEPSRVIICPAFGSTKGVSHVVDIRDGVKQVTVRIPNVIGYKCGTLEDLVDSDLALCIQSHGNSIIVFSLYTILGILRYNVWKSTERANVQDAQMMIRYYGEMVGVAAVGFEHKIADMVSVPIEWFLAGPTLRARIHEMGQVLAVKSIELTVVSLSDLISSMDNVLIKCNNRKSECDTEKLRWECGNLYHFIQCDNVLFTESIVDLKHSTSSIDLSNMPMYAPLMTPPNVCGKQLMKARDNANRGDWMAPDQVGDMIWNMDPRSNPSHGKHASTKCVNAPYKFNLYNHILQELASGKCKAMARMLNVH